MAEFLENILAATRADLGARQKLRPLEEIKAACEPSREKRSLGAAVAAPGISIVAEIKRASPSKGDIRPGLDVAAMVGDYEKGGAAAVSVLTEERRFKGSLDDLRTARRSCNLPLLRKDFIIDPYQIWEAAEAGADAVLLIVAALSPSELGLLQTESILAGLECLVETHDQMELEIALATGAGLIGINNRNLHTFKVNLQTTLELAELVPEGVLTVSESGIATADDVARLARAGVDGILVGESLMRSDDPAAKIRSLLALEK